MTFAAEPIQRIRRTANGRGSDRRPLAPTTEITEGTAAVEPVSATEAQNEGVRAHGTVLIVEPSMDLRAADEENQVLADLVVYQGETYQVMKVASFTVVLPHLEVYATRVPQ